jgi:hypothetical protein
MRRYLIASDWATEDDARAVVGTYGEAVPFVKSAVVNLANKETWARLANAEPTEEGAVKLARTENQYADLATKGIDGAVEAFRRAHALYVPLSAKESPSKP